MSKKTIKNVMLAGLVLLGGVGSQVFAQNTTVTKTEGATLGDIFKNAGVIGWAIVVLSVIALAVIIKFFVDLKREKLAPPDILDELDGYLEEKNIDDALQLCEDEPNFLTNVVQAGLAKIDHPFVVISTALEEALDEESVKTHLKVGYLSLIAQIAPMMGLLGTVAGMIQCFATIAMKETGVSPRDLAGGIKAALITTLFGLIVAIPVAAAFVYFRNKVVMLTIEIGAQVEELFERFRPGED